MNPLSFGLKKFQLIKQTSVKVNSLSLQLFVEFKEWKIVFRSESVSFLKSFQVEGWMERDKESLDMLTRMKAGLRRCET
jgi:hypothetical protein